MTARPAADVDLYRFLAELRPQLRSSQDVTKVLRVSLRALREHFRADAACIGVLRRGEELAELSYALPRDATWDVKLLDAFIRRARPSIPEDQLLAPLRRRGVPWAVLALRRREGRFERGLGRTLARVTAWISEVLAEIDRERVLEVRARIDRKLMEEIRPQDLFYQILHGLRSLMRYDHSSALLIAEESGLRLVAEQIAWRKGKSRRIGLRLPLSPEIQRTLEAGLVHGFDRGEGGFHAWRGRSGTGLARLLDYNRSVPEEPDEGALLCAPLVTGDGLLGVLKVAARHPGTFGRYDAELLEGFVPQAAIAIRNSRRAETLEARMLAAEKKHAMAELARGVSHDINNALGAVIPLVQQIQSDVSQGALDPQVLADDLEQIHTSLQVCRRIFSGMLALARGAERQLGPADLERAARNALAVLGDGMERRGIEVKLDFERDLPALEGGQGDLDQLFLNLLANARDALADGGSVTIEARRVLGDVEIVITDTGAGIPEEQMARIQEPFFTTKPEGNGLGLSICRSIVWERNGEISFSSVAGKGTRVRVRFPIARPGLARTAAEGER